MKETPVYHPFLFALSPIVFLYAHNIEQVAWIDTLVPVGLVIALTIGLLGLLQLVFRNTAKAGILTSAFFLVFFTHGYIFEKIVYLEFGSLMMQRHRHLFLIWAIVFTCLFFLIARLRKNLHNLTKILNVISLSLIFMTVFHIAVYAMTTKEFQHELADKQNNPNEPLDREAISRYPDIYFIVLDGYGRQDVLRELFQFDNSEFINFLKQKKFWVASKSQCNYGITFLSLASTLNMDYINELAESIGVKSRNWKPIYQMVKNNRVSRFLKKNGYKVIHFSSGSGATERNRFADITFFENRKVNEFIMVLFQTTMLSPFQKYLVGDDLRARVVDTFSKLEELPDLEGPKFVFAHIYSPHPPYVFGVNGEEVPGAKYKMEGDVWLQKDLYINQMQFINKKLKILVAALLNKSQRKPIIILQSDHGPASTFPAYDMAIRHNPSEEMLYEKMSILQAIYFPAIGREIHYSSLTSVNLFRVIFNNYFDADLDILRDDIYYSWIDYPFKFSRVTEHVIK